MPKRLLRCLTLFAVAGGVAVAVALHDRVPQDPRYHLFADRRAVLGVPNFWNAISNVPFAMAGAAGLMAMRRAGARRLRGATAPAWALFFAATLGIAFGSAWYHLAPGHQRLTWDRLAMSVAFMSFLAVVIGEWIDAQAGRRILPLLVFGGVAAVGYWDASELRGGGDLRPYIVVQFLPLVLIPMILTMFPVRAVRAGYVWATLGAYAAAKLAEVADESLFAAGGLVSGHTLKHLAAAAGAYSLVRGFSSAYPREERTAAEAAAVPS